MAKNEQKTLSGNAKSTSTPSDGKLYLVRREFVPQEVIDGEKVDITHKDGTPVVRSCYILKLKLLGKSINFVLVCKDNSMKEVLEDFYGIAKTDTLPMTVNKQIIKNSDTGECVSFTQLFVHFKENDDIHKVQMICQRPDKSKFQMALEEYSSKYIISEEISEYRKERYEAALQAKGLKENNKSNDNPF